MALGNIGFGSKSGTSKTNSATQSQGENDPWDYSIPYLQDYLKEVGSVGGTGLTPDQKYAFEYLKGNAMEGNPWDTRIADLASDQFAAPDRSGQVGEAYGTLQNQLGDYASGKYLDPMSNPAMAGMLKQVADDASTRINQQFAGAGRDLSGLNSKRAAEGVSAAQLPILFDQFNRQQQNQIGAANALYGAGSNTATTQSALDAQRNALRTQGIATGQAALDARNQGANQILQLDQQIKTLPYEDLGMLGSLLFPVAGLGGQQDGTSNTQSTTKTKSSGFNLGLKL